MSFDEIRQRANRLRTVPLEPVLMLMGAERDRYDRAKWHTSSGILSVTGAQFMDWACGAGGGGAIDLVIHLQHLGFLAAVEWLSRHFEPSASFEPAQQRPTPALQLPRQDPTKLSRVRRYLLQERRLADSLIERFIDAGQIYADSRGNAIFLLLGKENRPVGAELRGTTQSPWRGMAPGSSKDLGYFSVSVPGHTSVVLCESAIDALSSSTLRPASLCISTAGARPNPLWLTSLVKGTHEILCGFDADPTGDRMADAMMKLHPRIKRLRPLLKDWNDVLKSRS